MRWHKWVVLIAGSTGSALRAVRSSNLHITPDARRDLVLRRKRDGLPVTIPTSLHFRLELPYLLLTPPQLLRGQPRRSHIVDYDAAGAFNPLDRFSSCARKKYIPEPFTPLRAWLGGT